MTLRTHRATWLLAAALVSLPAVSARADDADGSDEDVLSSISTEDGYELRRDERLFVLYAALNVAGYTRAEQVRALPFPRYSFHALRQKLLHQLNPQLEKLRPPVDHFLDLHPETLDAYISAILTLAPTAPYAPTAETPPNFAGLDKLLTDFVNDSKMKKWGHNFELDYREVFKKLSPTVDLPFTDLRKLYRLPEDNPPPLVLEPNPLDSPEVAIARRTHDGSHVVVFGLPSGDGAMDWKPALAAYSTLLASEACKGVTVEGLSAAMDRMHAAGLVPKEITEDNVVPQSLAAAVAAKWWSMAPGADVDAATAKGLALTGSFFEALNAPSDSFPPDKGSFCAQVASKINMDKTLTPPPRGSTIHK